MREDNPSMKKKTYTVTVTDNGDSFFVVVDLPKGLKVRKAETSHKKGTGDWVGTGGWLAGVMGMYEDD